MPGTHAIVRIVAVAAMSLALAGCRQAAPTAAPATGVSGFVLAGPTCPVEKAGASPCVRAVAGAEIVARDASGAEAGRTSSAADGAYFMPLAPGRYTLEPQPVTGLMGTPAPVLMEVTAGPPTRLDLRYDTGIR